LLLCGRGTGPERQRLIVQRIISIPHDQVELREPDRLIWSVEDFLLPLVAEIEAKELSLIVMHCHPGGYPNFSAIDDEGDRELFPSVHSWLDKPVLHGAAVMLPDGSVFARTVSADGTFTPIASIAIAGDRLRFFPEVLSLVKTPEHGFRMAQAFGELTYARLQNLKVAVVGCSGTGGIVVELLARCGVRNLVLVDPDKVTVKNLDRILNAQRRHAEAGTLKVDVLGDAVEAFGLGITVERYPTSILDPVAAAAVAAADIVFGCVDSVEGRHVLNELCSAYGLPYFDCGIHIEPDGAGGVTHAVATANYVQPGGSSLLSRGVYSSQELGAETWRRTDPAYYEEVKRQGYLPDVDGDRLAVIPINMVAANLAVTDFLARLHGFRLDPDREFATQSVSLTHGYSDHGGEGEPCAFMAKKVGLGDRWSPPL